MTLQPEKEYIITESCIISAENNLFSFRERKKEWATEIRARPYSNTATGRDRVLNILTELREFHADNWCPIGLQERTAWYKKIDKMIASLNIRTPNHPSAHKIRRQL